MESDSDGEMEEFSGMELPPLINSLKRILSEYPDGGQIIKELIQNAEDAGATEVKILYDGRNINQDTVKDKAYRKFFRGPALCLYNNSTFQDTDWKGIRMIDMSVKEADPLKVGKFGLGFKSVFHMTDYPCILSGRKLLLIDPQQPNSQKVNAMMDLQRLPTYKKRMDIDAFFTALNGTFGVSQDIVTKGMYNGTLFWFPLRQTPSKISSNLYNEAKVMALFKAVEAEHNSLLIFLKNLTYISLSRRSDNEGQTDIAIVKIQNAEAVQEERMKFKKRVKELSANPYGLAVHNTLEIIVQCTNSLNKGQQSMPSVRTWLVVNYFMGSNASPGFMALIQDKDFASSPYVSVGAPLPIEPDAGPLEGHVFCFLPLPREGTSLTGLPVHVNGFFALNQSRHHVKWLTDEQKQQLITDKDVLWNKHLITEALPIAYDMWIQKAVAIAKSHQNNHKYVASIHGSVPVTETVKGKWQELLKPLFDKLDRTCFMFSENRQEWVDREVALFTSPEHRMSPRYKHTVVKALTQMRKHHVDIPKAQVETLCHFMDIRDAQKLSPKLLSDFLRENHSYKAMDLKEKMNILQYLLKVSNGFCRYLHDLELIPVASRKWKTFADDRQEKIYKCSPEQLRLFPGLEDRFLLHERKFPDGLFAHYDRMCKQGQFQLWILNGDEKSEISTLLQKVIDTQMPETAQKHILMSKDQRITWLQDVWQYIDSQRITSICREVPLLPILKNRNWVHPDVDIVRACDMMILAEHGKTKLPEDVRKCLHAFGVKVVPSLPDWIPVQTIPYKPDNESLVKLLTHIDTSVDQAQKRTIASNFNAIKASCRHTFMQYLNNALPSDGYCNAFLQDLKMFVGRTVPGAPDSSSSAMMFAVNDGVRFTTFKSFPVRYPEPLVDCFGVEKKLLCMLGVTEIKLNNLILLTLQDIQTSKYSKNEVSAFMVYFVQNYDKLKADMKTFDSIISLAKTVPFLRCKKNPKKPSDLFDPTDKDLRALFTDEPMFPDSICGEGGLHVLKKLGLKSRENVSVQNLVTTATLLHTWSHAEQKKTDVNKKARGLMKILELYPTFLACTYNGDTLKQVLSDLECVEFCSKQTDGFPKWLPWYSASHSLCKPSEAKHASVANLVGSVMHVVQSKSKEVCEAFCWKTTIPDEMLLSQLKLVRQGYNVRYKADVLKYLRTLYDWLSSTGLTLDYWRNETLIWAREEFHIPEQVILSKKKSDLKLVPYFYYVADTFQDFSDLFLQLGCKRDQSIEVLLTTLTKIVEKQCISQPDFQLAITIIGKLAQRQDELTSYQRDSIPLPTYASDKVFFKPLIECTFTENPEEYQFEDEEDDEMDSFVNLHFVTKDITETVARSLGVKTLQRRNFMDTEEIAFEECGQEEELTTRLNRLIEEGYRDGLSVPKELLQNADDAGAHHLKFLYDERENLDSQESLLDKGMKTCQGSALWVFNDAKFTNDDFVNIRKLNAGTKENNVRTIGKFGLGFCSVYNLTDVPSFVSGSNIVILDPHKTHLGDALPGSSPGLKIDLSLRGNRRLLKRNKDQFKPYFEVFGCDLFCKDPYFDGTLFRLPLRTSLQAQSSKIKSDPYSKKDMSELLSMFIENAGNLLLFTQNIQSIEVYHLSRNAKSASDQSLVLRVTRDVSQWNESSFSPVTESILSQVASHDIEISDILKVKINVEVHQSVTKIKPAIMQTPSLTQSTWIVSWATGTGESKQLASEIKNALPLAAIAVPCDEISGFPKQISQVGKGFFKAGRLYCFLPIPTLTEQPWHLNGAFDVMSDRRQLKIFSEEDKSSLKHNWNGTLMSDAAVNAFVKLLIYFTRIPQDGSYLYHKLWPVMQSSTIQPLTTSFFKYIVREEVKIFKGSNSFHSFNEIIFLDSSLRDSTSIGDIAFDMLKAFPPRPNYSVVDMPKKIVTVLKENNGEDTNDQIQEKVIGAAEFIILFLKNIDNCYWHSRVDERNKLILFALDVEDSEVEKMLTNTMCIPCEYLETLKRPCELIHPFVGVSSMYHSTEGMFPSCKNGFRSERHLKKLMKLGMIENFLPIGRLVERCSSVARLSNECCSCAVVRVKNILMYLGKKSVYSKYDDDVALLRHINWLPVLAKPESWLFSWYLDLSKDIKRFEGDKCEKHQDQSTTLNLGSPEHLYRQQDKDYLASVACVMDEKAFKIENNEFWNVIGIYSVDYTQKHFTKIVDQLCIVSQEYNQNPKQRFNLFNDIYRKIVASISTGITLHGSENERTKRMQYVKHQLCDREVIPINDDKLVSPKEVAFRVREDCYPYLCKLPILECSRRKDFYDAIGVEDNFSVAKVVEAIKIKQGRSKKVSNREEIKFIIKLLQNLADAMEREGQRYQYYAHLHEFITGPDTYGILYPTHELVMEDDTFKTAVQMKMMHEDFPLSLGEQLGMKSKKRKCLQEISFAVPWGQKEGLVTRLMGLLQDYPCDLGIMKELLQNADDANSKELHFIKDYRTHSTANIFGEGHLQGPALCVYNDSSFTEDDLKGIQNLGMGSKQKDPSKTGQYGVGFNAVYHLTDTPSFLTKGPGLGECGRLCILDPLCKNIPVDESNPGLMCPADKVKENFPDVMLGYLESDGFFASGKGTMFRFPLRNERSDISSGIITADTLDSLLEEFIRDMLNVLLFVKSVQKIKVSNISSSKLVHEYTLNVLISKEEEKKRDTFFNQIKDIAQQNKEDASKNLTDKCLEVEYTLQIDDSRGKSLKWLVVQRFGFPKEYVVDEVIVEAFELGQLGHLPLAGIAVPYPDIVKIAGQSPGSKGNDGGWLSSVAEGAYEISRFVFTRGSYSANASGPRPESGERTSRSVKRKSGQLFTFLPLPIRTGFLVHINGHFSLDHSRRELWNEGYRKKWNELLGSAVIAPSWVSAIKYFHKYFTSQKLSEMRVNSWLIINKMMECYHELFPLLNDCEYPYSKSIVKNFYDLIFRGELELFPVVKRQTNELCVSWVALKSDGKMFGAVFDNVLKNLRDLKTKVNFESFKQHFTITDLLKDLGMNLISTPMSIHETFVTLGFATIDTATPSFVVEFLKSFQMDTPGSCSVGEMDISLENTMFANINRLTCLFNYILRADEFPSQAEGLPLLLTADNILHSFCTDTDVFCSQYWSLLPESKSVFVHKELLFLLDYETLFNENLLNFLTAADFQELLHNEELANYNSGSIVSWDKKKDNSLIAPAWVNEFWTFVAGTATQNTENEGQVFIERLNVFKEWSFLPARFPPNQYKLFPISKTYCLFYDRGENQALSEVICKIGLPVLDEDVLYQPSVTEKMQSILANSGKPNELLKCLSYHKECIIQASLTNKDAETVLEYFNCHVAEIDSEISKQQLRSLPLYRTQQGTLVNLEHGDVLVLPELIPADGLQEWATLSNRILLKQTQVLSKLYSLLGLRCADVVEFYARILVPKMHFIPDNCWLNHIQFISPYLQRAPDNLYEHMLIQTLKSLPFIRVGNKKKMANELYWHQNEVFSLMLSKTDFPPLELRRNEWKKLFKLLDMHFEVTDDMLLMFARAIESMGRETISNDTRIKSEVLLKCFLNRHWQDNTYLRIKSIKFICPDKIANELRDVFEQIDNGCRLICFENSVPSSNVNVCWSSVHLLQQIHAPADVRIKQLLGICVDPPMERVTLHCQNVSISFQEKMKLGTGSPDLVKQVMRDLYDFFQRNIGKCAPFFRRLDQFPIIYLPLHLQLVPAKAIVTELDVKQEIKPYLYRAPIFYGQYFDVFEKMGAKETIDLSHCMYVLQQLKANVEDKCLLPEELKVAKQSLLNLIFVLNGSNTLCSGDGILYLPNRKRILVDSTQLTISDNSFFEHQLANHVEINYFIGLRMLEIKNTNDIFTKLPEALQPVMLSKCVRSIISLDEAQQIDDSERAINLENFLHSDEFVHGVLRMVKHNLSQRYVQFNEDTLVPQITNNIRSTQIVCVSNLRQVLYYKDRRISGTEFPSDWHIEKTNDTSSHQHFTFYISEGSLSNHSNLEWIISLTDGLTELIQICTSNKLGYSISLHVLLMKFERRLEIGFELDKLRVETLGLPQTFTKSAFPKPGTYVEEHFHPFLEQAISPFRKEEYEFVVMELEDLNLTAESEEDIEPVYKYVHIKREIDVAPLRSDLSRLYLVDTGNVNTTFERIPIYRLYRFVRRSEDRGRDIVAYDSELITAVPFDETCKRIREMLQEAWELPDTDRRRIIKRLKLKWHPDRNPENQEYCTRIFNYISCVILLLEKGQRVSNVVDERTGRDAPDMSESAYHSMVLNVTRRGTVECRAFRDNIDEYNRSYRCGRYYHYTTAPPVPRPDINEAKRWMRQAKNDFKAANSFFDNVDDVEGYNWICYTCHQACEKALRAAHYTKDANNVPGRNHSLGGIVWSLGVDLSNQVREFESRLKDYNRMRYPDSLSRPDVPSDLYKEDDATFALEKSKAIIDKVEECFDM